MSQLINRKIYFFARTKLTIFCSITFWQLLFIIIYLLYFCILITEVFDQLQLLKDTFINMNNLSNLSHAIFFIKIFPGFTIIFLYSQIQLPRLRKWIYFPHSLLFNRFQFSLHIQATRVILDRIFNIYLFTYSFISLLLCNYIYLLEILLDISILLWLFRE